MTKEAHQILINTWNKKVKWEFQCLNKKAFYCKKQWMHFLSSHFLWKDKNCLTVINVMAMSFTFTVKKHYTFSLKQFHVQLLILLNGTNVPLTGREHHFDDEWGSKDNNVSLKWVMPYDCNASFNIFIMLGLPIFDKTMHTTKWTDLLQFFWFKEFPYKQNLIVYQVLAKL